MNNSSSSNWKGVTKANPCQICGMGKWCACSDDGALHCKWPDKAAAVGFRKIKECPDGGVIFRSDDDRAVCNRPRAKGTAKKPKPKRDWAALVEQYVKAITEEQITTLANDLNVSAESLRHLDCGWNGSQYTFPERDSTGKVTAIQRRLHDSTQKVMAGGHRGLYMPDNLADLIGPLLFVEGMSDTAACVTMEIAAVGRPNNKGGVKQLAERFRDSQHVIVVGENDRKKDGEWPGRDGARDAAQKLADAWQRPVSWSMPPEGFKDARDFLLNYEGDESLVDLLLANQTIVQPTASAATDLADRAGAAEVELLAPASFNQLRTRYPALHTPVLDGLIREGETGNIIAPTKLGKTWMVYGMALSVATGRAWLDTFACEPGKVLIIDNELHAPTIAHRIPKVAEQMQISADEYGDRIDILPLRGRAMSVHALRPIVERIESGYYSVIICDAWYRMIPPGSSENDNAGMMLLYNTLDSYAEQTRAAWVVVHHASKGQQGDKAVTDVGSGAGSQSRAVDAHIILRPHEQDDHFVLEAAVRSFPPVPPIGLRWDFPVWNRAHAIDVSALKGRKSRGEERQQERDDEGVVAIRKALRDGPKTPRQIRRTTGFGQGRTERLLDVLQSRHEVDSTTTTVRGNAAREYRLTPS